MGTNIDVMSAYLDLTVLVDIDAALQRIMGNKKLLFKLLRNFKGREMAGEVIKAVESGDPSQIAYEAHKMKGVSANLGLKGLESALLGIEACAKAGQDASELVPMLEAVVDETMRLIEVILESE